VDLRKITFYIWVNMGLNFSGESGKRLISFKSWKMRRERSYICTGSPLPAVHKLSVRKCNTERINIIWN
jgi:hypothetical protein